MVVKFYTIISLVATVLACSATLADSASAETTLGAEWLENGGAIVVNKESETIGAFLLEDKKLGVAVVCDMSLDGTVGAAGVDKIKEVLNSADAKVAELGGLALLGTGGKGPDCETEDDCSEGTAASPIEVWPVGIVAGWKTQLFTMENGETLDLIENSGFELKCLVLGVNSEDTCTAADTNFNVVNNALGNAEIPSASTAEPLGTCTLGGANSGVVEAFGPVDIDLVSGVLLSVNGL